MSLRVISQTPRHSAFIVLGKGLPLFLALALIAIAAIFGVYTWQERRITEDALREQTRFVDMLRKTMTGDLNLMLTDLRILARYEPLRRYIDDPNPRNRATLAGTLKDFAVAKRLYDQIRLLDLGGMEDVRINLTDDNAEVASDAELQPKADRYYFRDAISLAADQIYISPLDLNIEHGEVETPYKPMVRAATPVFDSAGDKRGVVVLNYLAADLLAHLESLLENSIGRVSLLNTDGYWLRAPRKQDEWGFMFPDKAENSFAAVFPEEWRSIAKGTSGQFETDKGIFTYFRICPVSLVCPSSPGQTGPLPPEFILVSHIGGAEFNALTKTLRTGLAAAGIVLLAILAPTSWLITWHKLKRKSAISVLRERERLYRALAENFPNGAVFLLDPNFQCLLAEGRGLSPLGLTQERLRTDGIKTIFPPESFPLVEEHFKSALAGRETSFETRLNDEVYQVYLVPVIDDDEQVFAEMLMTQNITDRKQMEDQLRDLATVDALTQLPNRRHFLDSLNRMIAFSRRYNSPLSLCMCDIDQFKTINDTHGHTVGDTVLAALGSIIQGSLRETDRAGRYGGDEFCIALPNTQPEAAVIVVERIRATLAQTSFVNDRGEKFYVTGSFGLVGFESNEDAIELISGADRALYSVKHSGRNKVCADTCTKVI